MLLAPAAAFYGEHGMLPAGARTIIIHSPSDQVVPYSHSLGLMSTGHRGLELWNAETNYMREPGHTGNHKLHGIIRNGMLLRACSVLLAEMSADR